MDPKWFPPPDRPFQNTAPFTAGANLVGIATLLLPQGRFRSIIAVPSILWLAYGLRQYSTGKAEEDYLNAVNVTIALFKFVDFATLRTPEQTVHRIGPGGRMETTEQVERMTLWQKLKWNLELYSTARGIGWNWQVKNTDHVPEGITRR